MGKSGLFVRTKIIECPSAGVIFAKSYLTDDKRAELSRRSRNPKTNTTTPERKRLNNKNSTENLQAILCENFGAGDYFITITFPHDIGNRNRCEELLRFLKRLREKVKSVGKQTSDFRYVYCKEWHKNGKLHFHIVMSSILTIEEVHKVWQASKLLKGHDSIKIEVLELDFDSSLAFYMRKGAEDNTIKGRSWEHSQTCRKPIKRVLDDKLTLREFHKAVNSSDTITEKIIRRKFSEFSSYAVTNFVVRYNDNTGLFSLSYKFYKPRLSRPLKNVTRLEKYLQIDERSSSKMEKVEIKSEQTDNQKSKERISHFNDYVYENYTKPYYRQMGIYLE